MRRAFLFTCLLLVPSVVSAQNIVFSDNFSTSTLDSATPAAPTANSTAYQVIGSKAMNPNPPTIAPGDLRYGIAATTGGGVEVQALFTTTPITLANPGERIQLRVVFNNTLGLLNLASSMSVGLFNAGQVGPVPGGLLGNANSSFTTAPYGYAQNWQGYFGQIANNVSSQSTRFMDRKMQTGADNRNQVTVISGSTIYGPANPVPVTIGSNGAQINPLALGAQYTEVLRFTRLDTGALQLENYIYDAGNNLLGSLMATTGTTPLTYTFDALAIGWRATANGTATTIDISSIQVEVPEPSSLALVGLGATALLILRRRQT